MKEGNITLKELVEIAIPFDETTHSKEFFLRHITPELEKQFLELYTKEYEKEIEKKGVYFIVNRPMQKRFGDKTKIKLSMCGKDRLPTISLDYIN